MRKLIESGAESPEDGDEVSRRSDLGKPHRGSLAWRVSKLKPGESLVLECAPGTVYGQLARTDLASAVRVREIRILDPEVGLTAGVRVIRRDA